MTRPDHARDRLRQQLARLAVKLATQVVERGLKAQHVDNDVTIGAGVFGADRVEFGGANDIGAWSSFGRRVRLGYATTIGVSSVLLGPARIGDFCQLGPHVLVYGQDHPVDHFSTYTGKHLLRRELAAFRNEAEIEIGHGVWIGCNATILRGTTIGNGSVIGAGSVVRGDIPPYSIAAGNPARVVRPRIDPELAALVDETKWWTLRGDEQVVLQEVARIDFRLEPERARTALLELLERRVEH